MSTKTLGRWEAVSNEETWVHDTWVCLWVSASPGGGWASEPIVQDSKRYTSKVEQNSATYRPVRQGNGPAFLVARLSDEITGPADVILVNSSLAETTMTSKPVRIEIADQVLAPRLFGISDPTAEELMPLRQMREASLKAGRQFPEYNPDSRYLTIRATGLDPNAEFVIIELEQGGKVFKLGYDDFSLAMGDRRIVRLPSGLKPGPVRVTITNTGAGRTSEPITIGAEIADSKMER